MSSREAAPLSTPAGARRRTGLRTPSLRRRVTLTVLVLIGAMLVVLVVVTDLVLGNRLEGQLRQRLVDRAGVAEALVDQVDSRDLARRLEGEGVSVVLTTKSGDLYAEGPLAGAAADPGKGAAPEAPATPGAGPPQGPGGPALRGPGPKAKEADIVKQGDRLTVTRQLGDGSTLTLLADASDVRNTLDQVRLVLALAALLVLLAAALLVPLTVARALLPLRRITEVARSITHGDRGQRLHPLQPATELGRTAVAFDDMLDAVVGAEARAVGSEARLRDFLSDAAHELRTPLTGAQASAEHLLREDPPRADREAMLLSLVRETRRAGRLVEDMLLMARIDRGLDLERRDVELRALAQQVVDARQIAHPGVGLSVTGPEILVNADADRMTQVIGNLVDNAAYAANGHGRVELVVWRDGSSGRVGLDVSDDGPGVPASARERIFERMVRLDEARSSHRGGAGLGLPIARGIARAHGGDLRCVAAVGIGARFRLELPSGGGASA